MHDRKKSFSYQWLRTELPFETRLGETWKLEAYSTQSASINTAREKKAKTAKKNIVENCGVRAERDRVYVRQSQERSKKLVELNGIILYLSKGEAN